MRIPDPRLCRLYRRAVLSCAHVLQTWLLSRSPLPAFCKSACLSFCTWFLKTDRFFLGAWHRGGMPLLRNTHSLGSRLEGFRQPGRFQINTLPPGLSAILPRQPGNACSASTHNFPFVFRHFLTSTGKSEELSIIYLVDSQHSYKVSCT